MSFNFLAGGLLVHPHFPASCLGWSYRCSDFAEGWYVVAEM